MSFTVSFPGMKILSILVPYSHYYYSVLVHFLPIWNYILRSAELCQSHIQWYLRIRGGSRGVLVRLVPTNLKSHPQLLITTPTNRCEQRWRMFLPGLLAFLLCKVHCISHYKAGLIESCCWFSSPVHVLLPGWGTKCIYFCYDHYQLTCFHQPIKSLPDSSTRSVHLSRVRRCCFLTPYQDSTLF